MSSQKTALIIGATQPLGVALTKNLQLQNYRIIATTKSTSPNAFHNSSHDLITVEEVCRDSGGHVIHRIDLERDDASERILGGLSGSEFGTSPVSVIDLLIVAEESYHHDALDHLHITEQLKQYQSNALNPLIIISNLVDLSKLSSGSKVLFFSSKYASTSIVDLNCESGDYVDDFGYKMSKSALLMGCKMLSIILKGKGISLAVVYPGTDQISISNHLEKSSIDLIVPRIIGVIEDLSLENTGKFLCPVDLESFPAAERDLIERFNSNFGRKSGVLEIPC
ncbi:hypothetical protein HK098_003861 [Nowakowskiella sp. JEL0407]|nr:hypothetical protein HK098_003861 [Nowakowskiella sp. JEL0407]